MRPEWTVGPNEAGRLDKFLAHPDRLGSRGRAAAAIDRGKVYLNGQVVDGASAVQLDAGDVVRVWMDKPGSAKPPARPGTYGDLRVVYEDDALVVVDKPAGLLAVPLERKPDVPSVFDQLETHLRSHGKRKPFVVHRIDQDTSGLVVFAKSARAQEALQAQFKRRQPERVYWAVVHGRPAPPAGIWRDRLVWDEGALIQKIASDRDPRGLDAVSEYRVLEALGAASLVEVRLQTGRRNQIRVQADRRGHPLLGEQRYAAGLGTVRPIPFGRCALHARRLAFRHPESGRSLEFEAPLPPDLTDLLNQLRRRAR